MEKNSLIRMASQRYNFLENAGGGRGKGGATDEKEKPGEKKKKEDRQP